MTRLDYTRPLVTETTTLASKEVIMGSNQPYCSQPKRLVVLASECLLSFHVDEISFTH